MDVFWIAILVWQLAPFVVAWIAHTKGSLSRVASLIVAIVAVGGTAGTWWVALNNSSSTSALIVVFAPFWLMIAVLLAWGADAGLRALARRR